MLELYKCSHWQFNANASIGLLEETNCGDSTLQEEEEEELRSP